MFIAIHCLFVVYLSHGMDVRFKVPEETVRQAVRLTAPVLKNAGHVDGSFIRRLLCPFKYGTLNLWDLF